VSFLEAIHVFTQLPWAWTIVAGTLASRFIVLPFTIRSMRASAALAPHQDRLRQIMGEFQAARAEKDLPKLQRLALEQKMLYQKAGFSMGSAVTGPLVQLPVTFGMFMGLRRMCDYPVEQLKHGGWDFLPDLTAADPTYILPLLSTALIPLTLKVRRASIT
jgi:YidC/Oxa1 family membrane protein insertase